MDMNTTVIICGAVLVALVLVLGFWVSIVRTQTRVITGAGDDPTSGLMKAVRAHGNSTEYAGALIGLFVILGLMTGTGALPGWVEWTIIAVTASRALHALGFLVCKTLEKPHPFKALGSLITYVGGVVLAVYAVVFAIGGGGAL